MIIVFLLISFIFGRLIGIDGNKELIFYEEVEEGGIFKFIFKTTSDLLIEIRDPDDKKMFVTESKEGTIFTKVKTGGNVKIIAKNLGLKPMGLEYKCPDIKKEMIGRMGYTKETDLVDDLAYLLDELIVEQDSFLEKTKYHQHIIKKSRKWAQILNFIEIVLCVIIGYFLHKDFIKMFETKRTI